MMCNPRRSAFSLVEMLIVISLIALMLSIAMPALQNTREVTRLALCLTNHKELAGATQHYLADNDMYFPTRYSKGSSTGSPISTQSSWIGKAGNNGGYFRIKPKHRWLTEYLDVADNDNAEVPLAHCPSDSNGRGLNSNGDLTGVSQYDLVGTSYTANNGYVWNDSTSPDSRDPGISVDIYEIDSPDGFVIFTIFFAYRAVFLREVFPDWNKWHGVGNMWNTSFADGHAEAVKFDIGAGMVTPNYTFDRYNTPGYHRGGPYSTR